MDDDGVDESSKKDGIAEVGSPGRGEKSTQGEFTTMDHDRDVSHCFNRHNTRILHLTTLGDSSCHNGCGCRGKGKLEEPPNVFRTSRKVGNEEILVSNEIHYRRISSTVGKTTEDRLDERIKVKSTKIPQIEQTYA